ncbi:GAF domain-containing sensor histidine kinase [Marinagarivorans algicola]|uniref:GAF domain-containing sensor histidine kinase n=1 Tax=Marinagarivorans algicola TaxID=1513270 RepID=UPI003734C2A8
MKYPAFIDDTTYLSMDASASETEQLRAMLNNLTRVHLLTASKFESFDDLIHEYITSGIEVFGLETGIVSEITGNSYRVCDVISPITLLAKGQTFELEDTYCREVIRHRQVLGFPNVGVLDYMSCHPVYQNLQLEAYLSAPIFVDEELFGTLNFTSTAIRSQGFSIHERNLIVLMADAIGAFILLRNKEDRLLALNEKMKRFVGYVAHDLRNPLGTIIGLAQMACKHNTSTKRIQAIIHKILTPAETALEFVNTILENAALSTGKITLNQTTFAAHTLLNNACHAVAYLAEQTDTRLKLVAKPNIMVIGDEHRLQQVLINLLTNAIKYSPKHSSVILSAQPSTLDKNNITLSICNAFSTQTQMAPTDNHLIYGSVGFGLDIAQEIIHAHYSALSINQEDGTYICQFDLRRPESESS